MVIAWYFYLVVTQKEVRKCEIGNLICIRVLRHQRGSRKKVFF